jgi:hypothetical protein
LDIIELLSSIFGHVSRAERRQAGQDSKDIQSGLLDAEAELYESDSEFDNDERLPRQSKITSILL